MLCSLWLRCCYDWLLLFGRLIVSEKTLVIRISQLMERLWFVRIRNFLSNLRLSHLFPSHLTLGLFYLQKIGRTTRILVTSFRKRSHWSVIASSVRRNRWSNTSGCVEIWRETPSNHSSGSRPILREIASRSDVDEIFSRDSLLFSR